MGSCRLDGLKAEPWPGELGCCGCWVGEEGLDQPSAPESALTLMNEVLFFLRAADSICTFGSCLFLVLLADRGRFHSSVET